MPYNVERILLMASNMSTDRVKNIMAEFESNPNGTKIPEDILASIQAHVVGMFLLEILLLNLNERYDLFYFQIPCLLMIQKLRPQF